VTRNDRQRDRVNNGARRSEEDPIGRRQLRTTYLPAKHRQLMPKHDDLQLLELARARAEQDESEQAAEGQVAERPEQEQLLKRSKGGRTTLRPPLAAQQTEPI
jgi:hypothetical protein